MSSMDDVDLNAADTRRKPGIRPEILAKMVDVPLRRITISASSAPPAIISVRPDVGYAMEMTRAGLAKIDFVAPEHAPSASVVAGGLSKAIRRLCGKALDLSPSAVDAVLSALGDRTLGIPPRMRRSVETMIAADVPSDSDAHDIFFNIRRASKPEPAFYVRSLFETLMTFRQDVAETPVTVGIPVLSRIETGLLTAIGLAIGEGPRQSQGRFTPASRPAAEDYPARRWIRGHQIFAALSQGLIVAMTELRDAQQAGPAQRRAVDHVVIGLEACAAALQFTGDFAEHIYDEHIRPTMCQPHMPRGFSGLLSADHMYLVRNMKEMRPALEALRALDPESHAAIATALGRVYDSHKHVCAKFVGTERSSLLMVSDSGRSSIEQLERFKTMRVRNLG